MSQQIQILKQNEKLENIVDNYENKFEKSLLEKNLNETLKNKDQTLMKNYYKLFFSDNENDENSPIKENLK